MRDIRYGGAKIVLFLLALLLATAGSAWAQRFRNPGYDYYLDVPIGWTVVRADVAEEVSFTDPDRRAIFQVFSFDDRFESADALERFMRAQFRATGDTAPFRFNGHEAILADYQFTAGRARVRGYVVFVQTENRSFAVMGYAPEEHYETYHDVLLSAIDSFSPGTEARRLPGPIAQFYYPHPGPDPDWQFIEIDEDRVAFGVDPGEVEAAEVLIEREARVLSTYGGGAYSRPDPDNLPSWATAWQRYYRAIYRDNFDRLSLLAQDLADHFDRTGVPNEQIPHELLAWLQGFEYYQTESLSRLLSPIAALQQERGDCDSLGLTYVVLLHHLGFDAILLISTEYAHAVAGVNVPGSGWRYPFEGKTYLAAELTAPVALGLIDETMADPGGWIPVGFTDPVRR
ncbi:MAG: hypothetical protein EA403_16325 [Spirochaetaceae bacterium]|nr:MAG: hypothetical protein EA403_16325 [Spirochaetaceae bacterium]